MKTVQSFRDELAVTAHLESPHEAVSLRRTLPEASFVGCADIHATSATSHSRDCRPGTLFAALPGTVSDGAHHVGEALERGATALLLRRPLAQVPLPQCIMPEVRGAYSRVCAALYGDPARKLKVTGVTGTNGKTTVTWLLRAMLTEAGQRTGLLGTVEYCDGFGTQPSRLTTPAPEAFARWLARMVAEGATHAAVELSSHALDQHRTDGHPLEAAIVTNITHDHLDYHSDVAAYRQAKARILLGCRPGAMVALNADDAGAMSLAQRLRPDLRLLTYGFSPEADVTAAVIEESLDGTIFELNVGHQSHPMRTRLVGRHNVANCLAAATIAVSMGTPLAAVAASLEQVTHVPGRLERIDAGQPFQLFVDYAHTHDALEHCLESLRSLTPGRLICVFGAGGDRDKIKRPLMGRAAARADLAVVSSDNPRSEHPETIARDILAGFPPEGPQPQVVLDRGEAIAWAIAEARPGDCVVIAGKGHETVQEFADTTIEFDDRDVARELLQSLGRRRTA